MGAFENCKTVQEVIDLLRSMKESGTLTFNFELLAELRIIEIQSNDLPLPSITNDTDSEVEQDSLPSTSTLVDDHVSSCIYFFRG
jgi:hypothetical protein